MIQSIDPTKPVVDRRCRKLEELGSFNSGQQVKWFREYTCSLYHQNRQIPQSLHQRPTHRWLRRKYRCVTEIGKENFSIPTWGIVGYPPTNHNMGHQRNISYLLTGGPIHVAKSCISVNYKLFGLWSSGSQNFQWTKLIGGVARISSHGGHTLSRFQYFF